MEIWYECSVYAPRGTIPEWEHGRALTVGTPGLGQPTTATRQDPEEWRGGRRVVNLDREVSVMALSLRVLQESKSGRSRW